MAEQRLGIVRGMMASGYWDLHVTPNRVVASQVASAAWGPLFGAVGAAIAQHFANKRSDELARVSVQSALTAHKKNFSLTPDEIKQVAAKKPGTFSAGSFVFTTTAGKKHTLVLRDKKTFDASMALLQNVLGERITAK
jgi:hypothetical protein